MAYEKKARQEDTAAETRPVMSQAPGVERVVAPQVTSARGGAPKLNKNQLSYRWKGTGAQAGGRMPVPSTMSLPQTLDELKPFTEDIKKRLDVRASAATPAQLSRSRFWRMYKQYPEAAAALVARRVWTDQMVGGGNVADWMNFLEGNK
jgi:hypothetical protein